MGICEDVPKKGNMMRYIEKYFLDLVGKL